MAHKVELDIRTNILMVHRAHSTVRQLSGKATVFIYVARLQSRTTLHTLHHETEYSTSKNTLVIRYTLVLK